MGNSIKSDDSFGFILVELDQKSYFAGDTVTGQLDMVLNKEFPSNTISLVISGKEIFNFTDNKSKKWSKGQEVFFKHIVNLYQTQGNSFPPQQLKIPFNFQLPQDLPSSFELNLKNLKGKIEYSIWAGLMNKKKKKYFYSTFEFQVNEKYKTIYQSKEMTFNQRISTCFGKPGVFKMKANMICKNYVIGRKVVVGVEPDNSLGKIDVKKIMCQIIHRISFNWNMMQNQQDQLVDEVFVEGIGSGVSRIGDNKVEIQFQIDDKYVGVPSCEGKVIKSQYFVKIFPLYKNKSKKQNQKSIQFDIKILQEKPDFIPSQIPIPQYKPYKVQERKISLQKSHIAKELLKDLNLQSMEFNYPNIDEYEDGKFE